MNAGSQVWFTEDDPHGDDAWLEGEVTTKSDDEIRISLSSKPSEIIVRPRLKDEPGERYKGVESANVKLSEDERAAGADDDLIGLPHLHEPALLGACSDRFAYGKIYTFTGPILLAVNPFVRLPLYTEEMLQKYRHDGLMRSQNIQPEKKLEPHVYSIADLSFRQMMGGGRDGSSPDHVSQSILISGESGAGKTETTKIVMLYLTRLGAPASEDGGEPDLSVMEKVMESNPILEAFGNAKTLRNDNSSRFGKYIELGFSRAGILQGARVQTYLLEKVRVGFHASGERNYHIFYQILRGADKEMLKKLRFHQGDSGGLELANVYRFTSQGGAPNLRGESDADEFKYTIKAMRSMNWAEDTIDKVVSLVAGTLHLGEVKFDAGEGGSGETAIVANEETLKDAAELIGVELEKLKSALTERAIQSRTELIITPLSPEKAGDARDSLGKTIFGALFLWVVAQVNKSIGWEDDATVKSSIGVLDIFGFECFKINSFEQLCINFTNEALQQQFNKFVFKMEQAEYEAEKINWAFVSFPDNQDCLDTIQSRPNGILTVLDDEGRLPRGSDRNFASRLYKHYLPNGTVSENGRVVANQIQKGKSIFCIRHFAGLVEYSALTGFMEKNKDEIPLTAKEMFETAPNHLVKDVFIIQLAELEKAAASLSSGKSKKSGAKKTPTVGMQFKDQLISLMERVEKTEPHYIRCLKPNDAAKAMMMTKRRITEQLRCNGVLEAIKVARMGFPVRLDHNSFFKRYRMLLPSVSSDKLAWNMEGEEPQKLCVRLVELLLEEGQQHAKGGKESDGVMSRAELIRSKQKQPPPMEFPKTDVQLGITKVFMRKPPHDALESHRVFHQSAAITLLQCEIRRMQKETKYLTYMAGISFIQRFYRGCKGRERWWRLRESSAISLLTNVFRMLLIKHRYERSKRGIIKYQALYRGVVLRRNIAARYIQTSLRMRNNRFVYVRLKRATLGLQCAYRAQKARGVLAALQGEQKDMGKLRENNELMKAEMSSLKAMLASMAKGDEDKLKNDQELDKKQEEIDRLEKRVKELEKEIEREKLHVQKLEKTLEQQKVDHQKAEASWQVHRPPQSPIQQSRKSENLQSMPSPARRRASMPISPVYEEPTFLSRPRSSTLSSANEEEEDENVAPNDQLMMPIPAGMVVVSADVQLLLDETKEKIAKLEKELEAERLSHRDADGEIIKLRAEINGIKLDESDVQALLAPIVDVSKTGETRESGPLVVRANESLENEVVSKDVTAVEETSPVDQVTTVVDVANVKEGFSFEEVAKLGEDIKSVKETKINGEIKLNEDKKQIVKDVVAASRDVAETEKKQEMLDEPRKKEVLKMKEVEAREEIKAEEKTAAKIVTETPVKEVRAQSTVRKNANESIPIATPVPSNVPEVKRKKIAPADTAIKKFMKEASAPSVKAALGKLGVDMTNHPSLAAASAAVKNTPKILEKRISFVRSPSEYFPLVRRGFVHADEKEDEEPVVVGWKVEVTNRKEREEALRDEVRRFEIKLKRFNKILEDGVDLTLWQLNRTAEMTSEVTQNFVLQNSGVVLKLHKRGKLMVQAALTFNARSGYISKALGRGNKAALDPLPLHEILEVKAGCFGFESTDLPTSSGKGRGKISLENKQSSLFLTLKAAPTPMALSRSYFLRFKSRSSRNDIMDGLRGLLADLQIKEGVGISTIQTPGQVNTPEQVGRMMPGANVKAAQAENHQIPSEDGNMDVLIPLADVHKEINKQRQAYDRLLLLMLQGNTDLKEKEDDLMGMRGKLDLSNKDLKEKDRVQANDSKLIMQLSKKLETLLMDNEDLRDQNDRLNTRLVAVECEKMNLMSGGR